jgi:hypothetical protein
MKNAMDHQRKIEPSAQIARQAKLDLVMSERWQQLCDADQKACRHALTHLLREVLSQQSGNKHDER